MKRTLLATAIVAALGSQAALAGVANTSPRNVTTSGSQPNPTHRNVVVVGGGSSGSGTTSGNSTGGSGNTGTNNGNVNGSPSNGNGPTTINISSPAPTVNVPVDVSTPVNVTPAPVTVNTPDVNVSTPSWTTVHPADVSVTDASTTTSNTPVSVVVQGDKNQAAAATAEAPSMTSTISCLKGASAGVQTHMFGFSGGGYTLDAECNRREVAKTLNELGMAALGRRVMLEAPEVQDVFAKDGLVVYKGSVHERAQLERFGITVPETKNSGMLYWQGKKEVFEYTPTDGG